MQHAVSLLRHFVFPLLLGGTGSPVDAAAKLDAERRLNGVGDLRELLREQRGEFARCFTEKLTIYALGRGLDWYDGPAIDRIQRAAAAEDFRFSALIRQIVKSDAFRMRRGAEQVKSESPQRGSIAR